MLDYGCALIGSFPEAQRLGVSARFHTSLFESKIKGAKQTGRAAGCNRCGRGIA
jgi:hypothetical protein